MSDFETYDELLAENMRLSAIIKDKEEYEKCVARVNPPTKTYKELEEKLANFESKKQKEIDELWNSTIVPLQNEIKDKNTQLDSAFKQDLNSIQRIKDLERVIEKQNIVISMAAGYISSTPQFSNDHPINVKKWLMGGME
jgi:hypothetical protein